MSRLWREDRAQAAASVGSFVIRRHATSFRPWGTEDDAAGTGGGGDGFDREDETQRLIDEAYAQGVLEGRRLAEIEIAAERQALTRLASTLPTLKAEPTLPLALLLAETVDRLVREIVGEVDVDGLTLLARAKAAAALIGEATQPARLRVHPEDVALLAGAGLTVEIEGDLALARGSVLLETADGWIEDGPAVRLGRLRNELDKVAAAR